MDDDSGSGEIRCLPTKMKNVTNKTAKLIIVDLENEDTAKCNLYNNENKSYGDNENLNKDIVIEDCLSEPISGNRISESLKNTNSSVEDFSKSTNSSITSRSDNDFSSLCSLSEEFPKEILHLEFIENESKAKNQHLTGDEVLNPNTEPEKRRIRRRWQLNKTEKQPKRNRPFSSTCYSSDRTGKGNGRRFLESSEHQTNFSISDHKDLISIIKDTNEPLQDENKPKLQLQRSRTWTIIRRSKPLNSSSLLKKKEEYETDNRNFHILDEKSSIFINEDNDSSSSSVTDKTPVRKQWAKPRIDPEFMVSKSNEINEINPRHFDKDDTHVVCLNPKNSTAGFTCLNKHPSLLNILSNYSAQCTSKFHNKYVEINMDSQENISKVPHGIDDETEEENEDIWKSCRETLEEQNDISHRSSDELIGNELGIEMELIEKDKILAESHQVVSENENGSNNTSEEHGTDCLNNKLNCPSVVCEEKEMDEIHVKENISGEQEQQMVSNLEEIFDEEQQLGCELRKTRSKKLAWPLEALDDALGTLKKKDSVEKSTAMQTIGRLAIFYPEIAEAKQLILIKGLANEIKDHRPSISRLAIVCVLSLFSRLNFNMVQCIIEAYDALLSSLILADNQYLKNDITKALDHLTRLALPQQAIQALLLLLDRYDNIKEREILSHLLDLAVRREDGITLLQTHLPLAELLLNAAAQFMEDSNLLVRTNGQKIISHFECNPTFKTLLLSLMSEATIRIITPLLQENI